MIQLRVPATKLTWPDNVSLACIFGCNELQCGAFLMRLIFSKMFALTCKLWCVFCRFNLWFIICPVTTVKYEIYCYIGPRYHGALLFIHIISATVATTKHFCSWATWPSDSFCDTEATDVVIHTHPHGKNGTNSARVSIKHISDDSTAVVPCTTFCSDHYIRIDARAKRETGPSFDKTMLPCFIDSMALE